ncbi:hypothetical protein TorRG33x02_094320, partial [Trema orientale]
VIDGNTGGDKFNIIRCRCAFVSNFGINGYDLVCRGEKDDNEGGFVNTTSRKNITNIIINLKFPISYLSKDLILYF